VKRFSEGRHTKKSKGSMDTVTGAILTGGGRRMEEPLS